MTPAILSYLLSYRPIRTRLSKLTDNIKTKIREMSNTGLSSLFPQDLIDELKTLLASDDPGDLRLLQSNGGVGPVQALVEGICFKLRWYDVNATRDFVVQTSTMQVLMLRYYLYVIHIICMLLFIEYVTGGVGAGPYFDRSNDKTR
jgi:hypothetical protein